MKRFKKNIILVICAGMFAAGCATSRGVLDIETVEVENPASSIIVKIVEVTDKRVFEIAPKKPSIPSLKNGEIDNPAITSRAVARKRNSFGAALGDILLPENRTVTQVTEEALSRALKESGYRVASKGDPDYESALPLKAEIKQFWGWFNPGFWVIKVNYRAEVELQGDWPITGENRIVKGASRLERAVASGAVWKEAIQKGMDDFITNMKSALKKNPA